MNISKDHKMKRYLLPLLYLQILTTFAGDLGDVDGDLYGYIGFGAGYSLINSDLAGDGGEKKGFYWQTQANLTYYSRLFETSFGLGYFDTSQKPANKAFQMTTQTTYLEFSPRYRFHHRFSVGPSYRQIIGEELLYAPSRVQNINGDITTNNTLGIHFTYDIPMKSKYRMKLEAAVHKAIDSNERDMYLSFLQLSFGFRLHDNQPVVKEKIVIKEVVREVIKKQPSEIIELDEQVLSFEPGRYEITAKSLQLLEAIASVLKENLGDWEIIKVVGHTDANGPQLTNKRLSQKRAQAVAQIFFDKGIDKERVFVIGRGEEKLKSSGKTTQDHLLNRRVELNFVGKINKDVARQIEALTAKLRSDMRDTQ
jgi:outer membrane protein OmpA-like peptidoglycan-associated protein